MKRALRATTCPKRCVNGLDWTSETPSPSIGCAGYFLIVDFVRLARESGIPSTALGSPLGGAAVADSDLQLSSRPLDIHDLAFERLEP